MYQKYTVILGGMSNLKVLNTNKLSKKQRSYSCDFSEDADDEYEEDDELEGISDRITDECKVSNIMEENKTKCVKELNRIIISYYPKINVNITNSSVNIIRTLHDEKNNIQKYILSISFSFAPTQISVDLFTDGVNVPVQNYSAKPKNITDILNLVGNFIGLDIIHSEEKDVYLQNNSYNLVDMTKIVEKFTSYS